MDTDARKLESLLSQSRWLAQLAHALVRDAALADDLVQDVWMAALESPPERGRERSWLRTVLKRRVADHFRSPRRRNREIPDALVDGDADTSEAAATLEIHARLADALRALHDPYRSVIVARYFHGQQPAEIARLTDVPAATIRSQLARGRAELRRILDSDPGNRHQAWPFALMPLALHSPDLPAATSTTAATSVFALVTTGAVMAKKIVIGVVVVAALGLTAVQITDATSERDPAITKLPAGDEVALRLDASRERHVGTVPTKETTVAETSATTPPHGYAIRVVDKARQVPLDGLEVAGDGGEIIGTTDDEGRLDDIKLIHSRLTVRLPGGYEHVAMIDGRLSEVENEIAVTAFAEVVVHLPLDWDREVKGSLSTFPFLVSPPTEFPAERMKGLEMVKNNPSRWMRTIRSLCEIPHDFEIDSRFDSRTISMFVPYDGRIAVTAQVQDVKSALGTLTVGRGGRYDLQLEERFHLVGVFGRIEFEDGDPIPGVNVVVKTREPLKDDGNVQMGPQTRHVTHLYESPEGDRHVAYTMSATTDAEGRFTIPMPLGEKSVAYAFPRGGLLTKLEFREFDREEGIVLIAKRRTDEPPMATILVAGKNVASRSVSFQPRHDDQLLLVHIPARTTDENGLISLENVAMNDDYFVQVSGDGGPPLGFGVVRIDAGQQIIDVPAFDGEWVTTEK